MTDGGTEAFASTQRGDDAEHGRIAELQAELEAERRRREAESEEAAMWLARLREEVERGREAQAYLDLVFKTRGWRALETLRRARSYVWPRRRRAAAPTGEVEPTSVAAGAGGPASAVPVVADVGIPRPGSEEYRRHLEGDIEHYSDLYGDASARERLTEPAPAVWELVTDWVQELIRERTGRPVLEHLEIRLRGRPEPRMVSLGSGPGGVELEMARRVPDAEILCLDINGALIELGSERAAEEGLRVRFEEADLNVAELPERSFDLVFCHATLHHLVELEHVADQIRRTLRGDGHLVIADVIARNGSWMWPETRKIAQGVFGTLPERLRINHTAYSEPAVDDELWEADTSQGGMECIRSEDVLPVLDEVFSRRTFVPYFAFARRFFDTMYGPNYDPSQPLDGAIARWIWELDRHLVDSETLRPEAFFGIFEQRRDKQTS